MRSLLIVFLPLVLSLIFLSSRAYAQDISLICQDAEGNYALGTDPVKLGAEITCFVNPSEITAKEDGQITVTSPSGGSVIEQAALQSGTTPFSFIASESGTYSIVVSFTDTSEQFHQITGHVTVSFDVVPESPIGVLALIVSSLVVLGGFLSLKQYRARSSA